MKNEKFHPANYKFDAQISKTEAREANFYVDCLAYSYGQAPVDFFNLSDALSGLQTTRSSSLATESLLKRLKDDRLVLLIMNTPRPIGIRPDATIIQEPGQSFSLLYNYRGRKFPQVSFPERLKFKPISASPDDVKAAIAILQTRAGSWVSSNTLAFTGRPDGQLDIHRVYNLLGFPILMKRRPLGQLPKVVEQMMQYHEANLYTGINLPTVIDKI